MKPFKKIASVMLCFVLGFTLTACNNYHDLNEFSIVVGMAIDYSYVTEEFTVKLELLDFSGDASANQATRSRYEILQGASILDAVASYGRYSNKQLHFGNMEVVIFGQEVVKKTQVSDLFGWFLHNTQIRETTQLFVSSLETAGDIFFADKKPEDVISFTLRDMVLRDEKKDASQIAVPLYKAVGILGSGTVSLSLPALSLVEDEGGYQMVTYDRLAVFDGEYLKGYLLNTSLLYFQFLSDNNANATLNMELSNNLGPIGLYFTSNQTEYKYFYDGETIVMKVFIKAHASIDYSQENFKINDYSSLETIEKDCELTIRRGVEHTMAIIQKKLGTDIVGFGQVIYNDDIELWNELSDNWNTSGFKNLIVEVYPNVYISDSGNVR